MSIKRSWAAILVVTLLAGVLSGCTPKSVADGEIEWSDKWVWNGDGSPPALWEEPDRLILFLGGSSSCPSVITKVEEESTFVTMTLERGGGPLCTADLVLKPTYFTLKMGRPDHVVLKDGSEEYRLEVVDPGS